MLCACMFSIYSTVIDCSLSVARLGVKSLVRCFLLLEVGGYLFVPAGATVALWYARVDC